MNDDLIQQQFFALLELAELTEKQQQRGAETLAAINTIMADFRAEAAHINNNGDLSDNGKATRRAALAQEVSNRLERFSVNDLDQQIAELAVQLTPQHPDTDPVIEEMREQEARSLLRDRDELELMGMYQTHAVDGTNDLLMRAIENAPLPLITDPAIIAAGKEARAARQSPKAAQSVQQLKALRATIEAALNTARAELGLAPDELLTIAREGAA